MASLAALVISNNEDVGARFSRLSRSVGWETVVAISIAEARNCLTNPHLNIRVALVDELITDESLAHGRPGSGAHYCRELSEGWTIDSIILLENRDLRTEEDRKRDGTRIAKLQSEFKFTYYFYSSSNEQLLLSALERMLSEAQSTHTSPLTWKLRVLRRSAAFFSKYNNDTVPGRAVCNPELLYNEHSAVISYHGEDPHAAQITNSKLGIIFHSLSPCGDGLSLIASLGRDFAIASTLKVPCLRYCIQGPAWAIMNHSIDHIFAGREPASIVPLVSELAMQRVAFLRRFDKRRQKLRSKKYQEYADTFPIIDSRVIDTQFSYIAQDVVFVDPPVREALKLLDTLFPAGVPKDRSVATRALDTREIDLRKGHIPPQTNYTATDEIVMLKALKGVLSVSPELDKRTLSYFFAQNVYLDTLGCGIVRLGPSLERSWDAAFEASIKQDAYRAYTGIYSDEYKLADGWGLPYSFVSGSTFLAAKSGTLDQRFLMFIGDDAQKIELILRSAPNDQARRFVADIISFSQYASLFDHEAEDALRILPASLFGAENFMPPGSHRCMAWLKKAFQSGARDKRDDCPQFLVPYLLTNQEWNAIIVPLSHFLSAIGDYCATYLPRMNLPLLTAVISRNNVDSDT